jgi:hypothetical protein
MSPPNGTYETRNIKSGSEKGIDAGHVGDISSGAAETPLKITCPRRGPGAAAYTAKTSKIGAGDNGGSACSPVVGLHYDR